MDNSDLKLGRVYFPELDVLKGIAVILMLLGHSIQISYGESDAFFDNIVFKMIYSFHMPLFIMVSGYLFEKSIEKKNVKLLIFERCHSVLIPLISWNLLINGKDFIVGDGGVIYRVARFSYHCIMSYWFLWSVLYCTLGAVLIFKVTVNKSIQIMCFAVLMTVSFFTPDIFNSECYKFMFPCFIFGCCLSRNAIKVDKMIMRSRMLVFLFGLYVALFVFFKRDAYIYIGFWSLLRKRAFVVLGWDIYRTLIGVVGSLAVYMLTKQCFSLRNNLILQNVGKKSMGIYIISMQLNRILKWVSRKYIISWWAIIIESLIMLIVCYFLTVCLSKFKFSGYLFLGRRKNG